jgi:hypothetical protein
MRSVIFLRAVNVGGENQCRPANEVVEKYFGTPATTRNWNTIEKVAKILRDA